MPSDLRPALSALAARVVRLGHSSSFVRVSIAGEAAVDTFAQDLTWFVPDPAEGDWMLRWVSPAQRTRLTEAFGRHRDTEPRLLPAEFVGYRESVSVTAPPLAASIFAREDWFVFARGASRRHRLGDSRLGLVKPSSGTGRR